MRALRNKRVAIDIASAAKDLAHNPELLAHLFDAMSAELGDRAGSILTLGLATAAKATENGKRFAFVLGKILRETKED